MRACLRASRGSTDMMERRGLLPGEYHGLRLRCVLVERSGRTNGCGFRGRERVVRVD